MRGEEGYRTRVLLDGIDLSDPSSPQISPRIEHLLTEGIERIEILRGPQGLMYGADAGGVISLTSRQTSEGVDADLFVEVGEEDFTQLGINLSAGNDWIQGSVAWADMSTDGFNARPSDVDPADKDGYENQTLHGNL
ncbi:MAG: TonB-dependent receptor, partial [Cellvibrionales bacterium]|nr:TonB-dependent receptor [Cellvibrionales bacterium]